MSCSLRLIVYTNNKTLHLANAKTKFRIKSSFAHAFSFRLSRVYLIHLCDPLIANRFRSIYKQEKSAKISPGNLSFCVILYGHPQTGSAKHHPLEPRGLMQASSGGHPDGRTVARSGTSVSHAGKVSAVTANYFIRI